MNTAVAFTLINAFFGLTDDSAIVAVDYLACRSERTFDQGEAFRRSGDSEATGAFLARAIFSGQCIWLRSGTPVRVVGNTANPRYVVVIPIGEIQKFVTYRRFIQNDQDTVQAF